MCQNGTLMLWAILYCKILFQWLICKFSSVILKEIATRDVKLVLHGYLKYKKAFFVFYIDFYFGFLLVIGVYNCQTKISEVPMVWFLIFLQNISENVVQCFTRDIFVMPWQFSRYLALKWPWFTSKNEYPID